MAFQKVGVEAVIEGLGSFESGARSIVSRLAEIGVETVKSAVSSNIFTRVWDRVTDLFDYLGHILLRIIAYRAFDMIADGISTVVTAMYNAMSTFQAYEVGLTGLVAREMIVADQMLATSQVSVKASDAMITRQKWLTEEIKHTQAQMSRMDKGSDAYLKAAKKVDTLNLQIKALGITADGLIWSTPNDRLKSYSDVADRATVKSGELLNMLAKLAILSPYSFEAVFTSFQQAMAYGFPTEEAATFTRAVLTMAAGVGADNARLERMSYNLAQIRLQGKVTALDVRQLALAGFDLNAVLIYVAKAMGYNIKTYDEFNTLIATGKITWVDFTSNFAKYADTMFGGAAERMARTLQGLSSTFKDFFTLTLPKILSPVAEKVTAFANTILDAFIVIRDSGILEGWGVQLADWFQIPPGVADAIELLGTYFTLMGQLSRVAGVGGGKPAEHIRKTLEGLVPGGDFLKAIVARLWGKEGVTKLKQIRAGLSRIGQVIRFVWTQVKLLGTGDIGKIFENFGVPPEIADQIQGVWDRIADVFWRVVSAVSGLLMTGDIGAFFKTLFPDPNSVRVIEAFGRGFEALGKFMDRYGWKIIGIIGGIIGAIFGFSDTKLAQGVGGIGAGFETFGKWILERGPGILTWFENLKKWIEEKGLPAVQEFIRKLTTEWMPAFGGWLERLVPIDAALSAIGLILMWNVWRTIGGLLLSIGDNWGLIGIALTSIETSGGLGAFLTMAATDFLPVAISITVFGLALLVASGYVAMFSTNFGGFRDEIYFGGLALERTLNPQLERMNEAFKDLLITLGAIDEFTGFKKISVEWDRLIASLAAAPIIIGMAIVAGITGMISEMIVQFTGGFDLLMKGLREILLKGIPDEIAGAIVMYIGLIAGNKELIKSGAEQMWSGIGEALLGTVAVIGGLLQMAFGTILGIVWGFISGFFGYFVNLFGMLFGGGTNENTGPTGAPGGGKGGGGGGGSEGGIIGSIALGILGQLVGPSSPIWSVPGRLAEWTQSVIDVFIGLKDKMYTLGTDIAKGLWNGINSMKDWIIRNVEAFVQSLIDAAQELLGSGSPSKVFGKIGLTIPQGLAAGIARGNRLPIRAMSQQMMAVAQTPSRVYNSAYNQTMYNPIFMVPQEQTLTNFLREEAQAGA